jgi:hypothetical protein
MQMIHVHMYLWAWWRYIATSLLNVLRRQCFQCHKHSPCCGRGGDGSMHNLNGDYKFVRACLELCVLWQLQACSDDLLRFQHELLVLIV